MTDANAPRRILILLAHPVLEKSRVNRRLAEAVRDLPDVTIHDLYEDYPTLEIDVAREKELLLAHDVLVFQHPFYWYSTPAILKEWQDLVLEHGWAYGESGRALVDKITFNAVTTGGPLASYQPGGMNHRTVRDLLAPYELTARLCKMRYLPPFVVHASLRLDSDADVAPHAECYRQVVEAIRSRTLDLERVAPLESLNEAGRPTTEPTTSVTP